MPGNTLTKSASKSASKSATRKNKGLTAEQKAEIRRMIEKYNAEHVARPFNPLSPPSNKAARAAGLKGGRRTRRR